MKETVSVIIPTLNAAGEIGSLIENLRNQTVQPDEIIVVDSSSEDSTTAVIADFPFVTFLPIERKDFDHGGTRDWALRKSKGDFVLFLTQDALPVDNRYIENLLKPFEDPNLAACSGRQLPKADAREFEKLVRNTNYPPVNRKWNKDDRETLGVRAFLISDVCAAYRRTAYLAVGGFEHPILTNEDMLIAERFLSAGYSLAYCADAEVYHSHNLTFRQQYKRNYIIGQTLKRYEDRFQANETGTGMKLALTVSGQLLKKFEIGEFFAFGLDCVARFTGNRRGRKHAND